MRKIVKVKIKLEIFIKENFDKIKFYIFSLFFNGEFRNFLINSDNELYEISDEISDEILDDIKYTEFIIDLIQENIDYDEPDFTLINGKNAKRISKSMDRNLHSIKSICYNKY